MPVKIRHYLVFYSYRSTLMQEWMEFLLHFATESFYTKIRVHETRWRVLFSHTLLYIHMNYYFKLVCILFYIKTNGAYFVFLRSSYSMQAPSLYPRCYTSKSTTSLRVRNNSKIKAKQCISSLELQR